MGKKYRDPDHVSESLETIFGLKILKFFDADPDPGTGIFFNPVFGMKKFGSGMNIPDPQQCYAECFSTRVLCAGTGSMCGPTRASCCLCPAC
jgi:hypothetical protein